MSVSDYIKQLLSVEEYSFSLNEVISNTSRGETSVKSELSRLIQKNEIVNLRKGFYLIIPPRYSRSKKLPVQLYSEKLFKYLNRNYYIGLFSAAKIHGASHQQPQRDYLITGTPKLNAIKKNSFDIQFYTITNWPIKNVDKKRSDAGNYHISSPALSFVDLIHHHTKIGGLNRVLATLEEVSEEITHQDLEDLISWYQNKSNLQRSGFFLDELYGENSLSELLYRRLSEESYYPILLSPKKDTKPGSTSNRWKVDVNIKLESDL